MVELHRENETWIDQKGDSDEKLIEESKAELLKQIDDEKRANLNMPRREKQMNKPY